MLIEAKTPMKHGEWIPWIEAELPFNDQQSHEYMQIAEQRELENVHLNGHIDSICKAIAQERKQESASSNVIHLNQGCEVSDLEGITQKFGTVYADPPWLYGNQGTRAATSGRIELVH